MSRKERELEKLYQRTYTVILSDLCNAIVAFRFISTLASRFRNYTLKVLVREAEVQKYMSTYHIEGQFHFALKLSVTCLI